MKAIVGAVRPPGELVDDQPIRSEPESHLALILSELPAQLEADLLDAVREVVERYGLQPVTHDTGGGWLVSGRRRDPDRGSGGPQAGAAT